VSVAGYLLVSGVLTHLINALRTTVVRLVLISAPAVADQEAVAESVSG
jgi:hypothetical protein